MLRVWQKSAKRRQYRCQNRVCNRSYAIASNYNIPEAETNASASGFITRAQRKEAAKLIREDPTRWNAKALGKLFGVPSYVIFNSKVAILSKREHREYMLLNKPLDNGPRKGARPNRDLIQNWRQKQMDNLPETRSKIRQWKKAGKAALTQVDMEWMYKVEKNFNKATERGIIRMEQAKKKK
eukprot:TRINITY_DN5965_c0_g1_i1.p1 TRINITY_DN5965_c0_g1~~TRINITY_DN5965_c0_g1_i1.p1  ORF type:complete len:182 (-),score=42.87 TRINITY_DN5965_c0_g1_i1:55-600(-)